MSLTRTFGRDISKYNYLRLEANNQSESMDTAGESLYVSLEDNSGNRIGGWADTLTYNGTSNGIGQDSWNMVRLDLNSMKYQKKADGSDSAGFDRTRVKKETKCRSSRNRSSVCG